MSVCLASVMQIAERKERERRRREQMEKEREAADGIEFVSESTRQQKVRGFAIVCVCYFLREGDDLHTPAPTPTIIGPSKNR